jgi:hypothetical protein
VDQKTGSSPTRSAFGAGSSPSARSFSVRLVPMVWASLPVSVIGLMMTWVASCSLTFSATILAIAVGAESSVGDSSARAITGPESGGLTAGRSRRGSRTWG